MFPIDLGSIADWVGAIGGLLAVVASVLAWKSSDRINKIITDPKMVVVDMPARFL